MEIVIMVVLALGMIFGALWSVGVLPIPKRADPAKMSSVEKYALEHLDDFIMAEEEKSLTEKLVIKHSASGWWGNGAATRDLWLNLPKGHWLRVFYFRGWESAGPNIELIDPSSDEEAQTLWFETNHYTFMNRASKMAYKRWAERLRRKEERAIDAAI